MNPEPNQFQTSLRHSIDRITRISKKNEKIKWMSKLGFIIRKPEMSKVKPNEPEPFINNAFKMRGLKTYGSDFSTVIPADIWKERKSTSLRAQKDMELICQTKRMNADYKVINVGQN
jgi:hypothetical protein